MNIKTNNQPRYTAITATTAAVTATIGLAAVSWIISIRQMNGMDMGTEAPIGTFPSFIAFWTVMMAAMMLPGAMPATVSKARAGSRIADLLLFVGAYLAIWMIFGVPVYLMYRPHGTLVAGLITIAAGIYELTPLKSYFRRRCHSNRSGIAFGMNCVGSSIGLMSMQVAIGVMSVTWMVVIAVLILAQKLLPVKKTVDIIFGLLIIAFGLLIIAEPSVIAVSLPSMPAMAPMKSM